MESDNPRVMEAVAHVRDTCQRYGVAPGIHTSDPSAANRRFGEGFQFIAVASELRFMLAGARGHQRRHPARRPATGPADGRERAVLMRDA